MESTGPGCPMEVNVGQGFIFFVGGGKFGARLRMIFSCLVVTTFQGCNNYSFVLFQHYLDKPHHFILTY